MDASIRIAIYSLLLIFFIFLLSIPIIYTKTLKGNTLKKNILLYVISIFILLLIFSAFFTLLNYCSKMAMLHFRDSGSVKFSWEVRTYLLAILLGLNPLGSFFIAKKLISKRS